MEKAVKVTAALIFDGDRFMICRRPPYKARGGLWEFVGGKVEEGETEQEALIRECREELDVTVSVGELFCRVIHPYPDLTVELSVYKAKIEQGVPKKLEHTDLRYILPGEADRYEFCPADRAILDKIAEEARPGGKL